MLHVVEGLSNMKQDGAQCSQCLPSAEDCAVQLGMEARLAMCSFLGSGVLSACVMPVQVGRLLTVDCATDELVCYLFTWACPPQVWAGERALPVRASLLEVCTDQQLLPQMLELQSRGASEATAAGLDLTGMQARVQFCL